MNCAIEFRNVKKAYGEKTIIENLNLTVEKGEFVTIVGSSGCGKTTALKMINGLIDTTNGEVLVDGKNIKDNNLIELRRSIGYSIQGSVLFPHMTVDENISYVPNLLNKKDLYTLSEKEVIDKIENCSNEKISKCFNLFRNSTKIEESDFPVFGKYCVSLTAKRRYIVPLVEYDNSYKRVNDISDFAKEKIDNYLKFKTKKYAYLDFEF